MKKLYTVVTSILFCTAIQHLDAQNDTLMFMDFQVDMSDSMEIFPDAGYTDNMWINWDEDGKAAAQSFPTTGIMTFLSSRQIPFLRPIRTSFLHPAPG